MKPIGYIHTDFKDKFGIPRQSGIIDELFGQIIFEPKYRQEEAFRGLEDFSHIWLLWEFHKSKREDWSATVKPPKLGGKIRMGVFATRSPFRPNPIGLSCVKLESITYDSKLGPILNVRGADLLDGTPIYDIKPYLPYADCHPEATSGFTSNIQIPKYEIIFPDKLREGITSDNQIAIQKILAQDPRPGYQNAKDGDYAMLFSDYDIHFHISENKITITEIKTIDI